MPVAPKQKGVPSTEVQVPFAAEAATPPDAAKKAQEQAIMGAAKGIVAARRTTPPGPDKITPEVAPLIVPDTDVQVPGGVATVPTGQRNLSDLASRTKDLPFGLERFHEGLATVTKDPVLREVTPYQLSKHLLSNSAVTLFEMLDPFAWPQRYSWMALYEAGARLPESDLPENPSPMDVAAAKLGGGLEEAFGFAAAATLSLASKAKETGANVETGGVSAPKVEDRLWGFGPPTTWEGLSEMLPFSDLWTDSPEEVGAATAAYRFAENALVGNDAELYREVGRNFYRALASGELLEKGKERRGHLNEIGLPGVLTIPLCGGRGTPNPWGIDIVEATVPKELAAKLAENAKTDTEKAYWGMLTTDIGRLGVGLGIDIIADPLWLFGPAKGAQIVTHGDKAYNLSQAASQAAGALEVVGKLDDAAELPRLLALRTILDALHGAPEKASAARVIIEKASARMAQEADALIAQAIKFAEMAKDPARAQQATQAAHRVQMAELRAMVASFADMPGMGAQIANAQKRLVTLQKELDLFGKDATAVVKHLQGRSRNLWNEANYWKGSRETLNKLFSAQGLTLVDEAGMLAWHVPFTETTRFVVPAAASRWVRGKIYGPATAALGSSVDRWTKPYQAEAIKAKYEALREQGAEVALSKGEQFALALQQAGVQLAHIPMAAMDLFAKTLGTRAMEPYLAMGTAADIAAYGSSGKRLTPFLGQRWVQLKKAHPEDWEAFVVGMDRYYQKIGSLDSELAAHFSRLRKELANTHRAQKRLAETGIPGTRAALAKLRQQLTEVPAGSPEAKALQAAIKAHRTTLAQYELWASKAWTEAAVFDEAMFLRESGAARIGTEDMVWFKGVVEWHDDFIADMGEKLGRAKEEVAQLIANAERRLTGDINAYEDVQAVISDVGEQLSILRQSNADIIASLDAKLDAGKDVISGAYHSVKGITIERLAEAVEESLGIATRGGSPGKRLLQHLVYGIEPARREKVLLEAIARLDPKAATRLQTSRGVPVYKKLIDAFSGMDRSTSAAKAERMLLDAKAVVLSDLTVARKKLDDIAAAARGKIGKAFTSEDSRLVAVTEALNRRLGEVEPTFLLESGPRALDEWERVAVKRWMDVTSNLSTEDRLLLSFAGLRTMPDAPAEVKKALAALEGRYPVLYGRRLGELDPTFAPLVREFQSIVQGYVKRYGDAGWKFVASPERMLRDWGVVDYVPHVRDMADSIRKGTLSSDLLAASHAGSRGGFGMDTRLGTAMDSRRHRTIAGTAREINQAILGVEHNARFAVDINEIMGRYMQANGALAAQDFMVFGFESGFIKAVKGGALEAAEQGLVPLFHRGGQRVGADVLEHLLELPAAELQRLGHTVEELQAMLAAVRQGKSPFATWLSDVPEVARMQNVQDAVSFVRLQQYAQGLEDLFSPAARFEEVLNGGGHVAALNAATRRLASSISRRMAEGALTADEALPLFEAAKVRAAWDVVAEELSALAAKSKGVGTPLDWKIGPIKGEDLADFYAPGKEFHKLYVPGTIAEGLRRVLEFKPTGPVKAAWDAGLSFWKTRQTILAVAFHSRNAVSNWFQTALGVDFVTAVDPLLHYNASRLALGTNWRDSYGSLERAFAELSKPKQPGESAAAFAMRSLRLKTFEGQGMVDLLENGVDMGEGFARSADDVLTILREKNVVGGQMRQYVDIDMAQGGLAKMLIDGDAPAYKKWIVDNFKLGGVGQAVGIDLEDAVVLYGSHVLSGGLPVVLPKAWGRALGQLVENQGRILATFGETAKTGSLDAGAAKSIKLMFDYSDLTAWQKTWARSAVPFFTWNQKNVMLQVEMMQKNPAFYSMFDKLLLDRLPTMISMYNQKLEGYEHPIEFSPSGDKARMGQDRRGTFMARMSIPNVPQAIFEGFGTAQEAFAQMVAFPLDFIDYVATRGSESPDALAKKAAWHDQQRALRATSMFGPYVGAFVEGTSGQDTFRDRPINDLTNGVKMAAMAAQLRQNLPWIGDAAADALLGDSTMMYIEHNGTVNDVAVVAEPWRMWALETLNPWGRAVSMSVGMAEPYQLATSVSAGELARVKEAGGITLEKQPRWLLYLNALTGFRIIQQNEALNRFLHKIRLQDATEELQKQRAPVAMDEAKRTYVKD
jgi:hypothetical protein